MSAAHLCRLCGAARLAGNNRCGVCKACQAEHTAPRGQWHEEARRLFAAGVPKTEIAGHFGVTLGAVSYAVDSRRRRLTRRAARRSWAAVVAGGEASMAEYLAERAASRASKMARLIAEAGS